MAERYRFFDSTPEDPREYSADEFAEYFRTFISNGIFNGGTNLKVTCDGNNINTKVNLGYAWLQGYMYKVFDKPVVITHELPDIKYDRIDRIVIRLDKTLEHRYVKAFIKKGIPGVNPIPPTLTRNENIFELSLAQVKILAGKSYIEQFQITDERLNNDVCGLANSLIQADTKTIFEQFQSWYDVHTKAFMKAWDSWLSNHKSTYENQWSDWFNTNTKAFTKAWNSWFSNHKSIYEKQWNDWFNTNTTKYNNSWESWFGDIQNKWTKWFINTKDSWSKWNNSTQSNWNIWYDDTKKTWDKWFGEQQHSDAYLVRSELGVNVETPKGTQEKVDKAKEEINTNIKQNTEDIQKVPFETNGESIKSIPSNVKGKCSDRIVHGGEVLNNLVENGINYGNWIVEGDSIKTSSGIHIDKDTGRIVRVPFKAKAGQKITLIINLKDISSDYLICTFHNNEISEFNRYEIRNIGINKFTLTLLNDTVQFWMYFSSGATSGSTADFELYGIVEGDQTNNPNINQPLKYGLNYPQDIELVGEGKNLFDNSMIKINGYWGAMGEIVPRANSSYSEQFIKLKNNITYKFNHTLVLAIYSLDKKFIERNKGTSSIIPTQDCYIRVSNYNTGVDRLQSLVVAESSTASIPYTPYQSSALKIQTPEKYPLVKLPNGVENQVVEQDGEIVEECGVKKLSDLYDLHWKLGGHSATNFQSFFLGEDIIDLNNININGVACNNLPTSTQRLYYEPNAEGIFLDSQYKKIYISIRKDKLSSLDGTTLKQYVKDNKWEIFYHCSTKIIHIGEQDFYVTGNLDTYPNGRIRIESYYNKNHIITDTNTIKLDTELNELTSVQMYMDNPDDESNDKILVLLKADLKDSKTIELDKKYTGVVKVEGRPKYHVNPSFSCNLATNLGAEIDGIKKDHNQLSNQVGKTTNNQDLINYNFDTRLVDLQDGVVDLTSNITGLQDDIKEVFQSGVEHKTNLYNALSSKTGVVVSPDDTLTELIQKVDGLKQGQGNAVESNVLSGKTFTNADGVLRTGTMPNRGGTQTITPSTVNQTLSAGYRSGDITVSGDADLKAENIKKDVKIFNITGTMDAYEKELGSQYVQLANYSKEYYNIDLGYKPKIIIFKDAFKIDDGQFDLFLSKYKIDASEEQGVFWGVVNITFTDTGFSFIYQYYNTGSHNETLNYIALK